MHRDETRVRGRERQGEGMDQPERGEGRGGSRSVLKPRIARGTHRCDLDSLARIARSQGRFTSMNVSPVIHEAMVSPESHQTNLGG